MKRLFLVLALFGSAQAACDTSYLLPPGTFTYQSADLGTTTIRNVATATGIKSTTTLDGNSSTATFTCQGSELKLGAGRVNLDLSTFPQGSEWHPGYTWTSVTSSSNPSFNMRAQNVGRVVALERVTTPAGSFHAYRVEMITTVKLNGTKLPKSFPKSALAHIQAPVKTTIWLARGVGVVKQEGVINRTLVKFGP